VEDGSLRAVGTDASGEDVSLSEPMPARGFLAGNGMAASIELAARAAPLAVGDTTKLSSLGLVHHPSPAIEKVDYEITREADREGQRVYRVIGTGAWRFEAELLVDAAGSVVKQTYTKPFPIEVRLTP
jgi:hypothetical protein